MCLLRDRPLPWLTRQQQPGVGVELRGIDIGFLRRSLPGRDQLADETPCLVELTLYAVVVGQGVGSIQRSRMVFAQRGSEYSMRFEQPRFRLVVAFQLRQRLPLELRNTSVCQCPSGKARLAPATAPNWCRLPLIRA